MLLIKIRRPGLVALGMLGLAAFGAASGVSTQSASALSPEQAQKKLSERNNRFIENAGQWHSDAKFLGRAPGTEVWVTKHGFTYDFFREESRSGQNGRVGHVVQMIFGGGSSGNASGVGRVKFDTQFVQPGKANRAAASYGEIVQKGIYPGVDARSYYDDGGIRYDLIVAPGANPNKIQLTFKGANSVFVKDGDIVLGTQVGERRQTKLFAYQNIDGKRKQIPAKFKKVGANTVAFELGSYDKTRQLVIDPLIYGSYYGGNGGFDEVRGVTTDTSGGVYLTGYTQSATFPQVAGPYGFGLRGGRDAFITKLQGDAYAHDYAAIFGGSGSDTGMYIDVDPFGDIWVAGLTASANFPGGNLLYLRRTSNTQPTGGTWTITVPGFGTTGPMNYNASPSAVQSNLQKLLGTNDVSVTQQGDARIHAGGVYKIVLPSTITAPPTVDSSGMTPATTYAFAARQPAVFIMRWAQNPNLVLTPFPQAIHYFGGDAAVTLANFAIVPNANPAAGDPVLLNVAGNRVSGNISDVDATPGPGANGYFSRISFDRTTNQFSRVNSLTQYVHTTGFNGIGVDLTGLAVDRFGSLYVGGTVTVPANVTVNVDTSVNPVFVTTAGVFGNGRLLRNSDLFVRKYAPNGSMTYSALIGGNGHDTAAGYALDYIPVGGGPGPDRYNTGTSIAVDPALNLYIAGVSRSFNYPRTRDVYGEIFSDGANVVVTKVNPNASDLTYSTNLRTTGLVLPTGIDVDARGNAFVTGQLSPDSATFPDSGSRNPENAANPNEPTAHTITAAIQITADALDPIWEQPPVNEVPTTEGFLSVLNSTATQLVYSSYIGGMLDDTVFAPYVDAFGDVWTFGYIDSARDYTRFNNQGQPGTRRLVNTGLPDALMSPLAFKRFPDGASVPRVVWYSLWSPTRNDPPPGPYYPWSWSPALTNGGPANPVPISLPTGGNLYGTHFAFGRDGFIIKQRLGLAAIGGITLNPQTAPGGLGQTIQGTVTLTDPAPVGGADIRLELNNTDAASFSANQTVGAITVNVPTGATTANFVIFTKPVQANTNVQVRATYQGSFRIAQFVVVPWLQDLALSPTSVVGGNNATGRITLAEPAPAGGVTVDLSTDTPSLVSFPNGTTVNVPEGQQSVVFNIVTQGVPEPTFPTIRATLLGVGLTRTLTLTQASLQSLTFNPPRVAGGTTTTGTLTLDGKAGSQFVVNLSIDSGTAGYVFPSQITFEPGESVKTFELTTAFEPTNTSRKITATRPQQGAYPQQTLEATIFVDAVFLTGFTLTPNTINGGENATGTVSISAPAQVGGVVVNLTSSNPGVATVPAQVIVPTGASSVSFPVQGETIAVDGTATITASRGPTSISRNLTVRGVTFTLAVDPVSVVGGRDTAEGIITLSSPAPAGGVTIQLASSNTNVAQVPGTVTVPQGSRTGTFTITTAAVSQNRNVTISGTLGTNTATANLEVRQVGVMNVTFTPDRVRGGDTTLVTVTLEAPAPAGGANVTIQASNPSLFVLLPTTVQVAAGQTSVSFTVRTQRVARTLATSLTATYGGSAASATLIVER